MIYFAYGSNMSFNRISERINNVKLSDTGYISNYELLCNKKSIDGSAKANIVYNPGNVVWGVLYIIDDIFQDRLDRIEGGYKRKDFEVHTKNGTITASAYISNKLTNSLPKTSYIKYIIEGAVENKLPEEYIDYLQNISTSD